MKAMAAITVCLALTTSTCLGSELLVTPVPATPVAPDGIVQFSHSWSPLPLLPRRFQNHCGFFHDSYVCANHCGPNYQVYYCSEQSFGCCHIGQGYCNNGYVQCAPHYFPFN